MPASSSERNPVERLAEEFAERFRKGERPSVTEYAARLPEHADEIRTLFPALVAMEQLKPTAADLTGEFAGDGRTAGSQPPEYLGDYRILREAGRGGMGIVYEAEQVSLGRRVALKVLPPHAMVNPSHLERFRREAKAAARLHHTNIVPVFGVGEDSGVAYYAMQFIRGEALDHVLGDLRSLRRTPEPAGSTAYPSMMRSGELSVAQSLLEGQFEAPTTCSHWTGADAAGTPPCPQAKASANLSTSGSEKAYYRGVARIGLQVAEALAYAHRQGILHRDIKPSNLLLDAQGTVWITDFGLAKADGGEELTQTGDLVGTLRFMAPERFDGCSLPQSDIYGLGLTLYELLTLQPAFADANKGRLIEKVLHEPVIPPRRIDRQVPCDLETTVLKCLAKDPAERYATADELAEDLHRFLADRPIRARRASPMERAWRWCRRNPAMASLIGAVGLLLVLFGTGSFIAAVWLDDERQAALANAHQANEARVDANHKLWISYLAQAQARRWSGRPGRRFDSLDTLVQAAVMRPSLELRNEAIACLALPDLKKGRAWDAFPKGATGLVFDEPLGRYARSDDQGNISIRRVDSGQEVARLPGTGRTAWFLRFSPNGRFLAIRIDNVLSRVWDIEHCRLLLELKPGAMEFAPDNSWIAIHDDTATVLYELPSGKAIKRLTPWSALPWGLAAAPNGRLLAACALSKPFAVQVRDLTTDRIVATLPHAGGVRAVAWRPDGKLLAAAAGDWRIHIWDTSAWQRIAVLEGHESDPIEVSFNHSGLLLASTAWDGTLRLWDPLAKKQLLSCSGGFGMGWPKCQFSPDDRQLAFGWDGRSKVWLWAVATANECRTFHARSAPRKRTWSVAISNDNRLLASTHDDGIRLWDLATNREVCHVPQGGCTQSAFFLPADKGLIAYHEAGLYLWPIRSNPQPLANQLHMGPPEQLLPLVPTEPACFLATISRDGRRIAASNRARGNTMVLDLDHRTKQALPGHGHVTISPDGRWVACWPAALGVSQQVTVAEVASGQVVWTARGRFMPGEFSPDGRWLATGGDVCRLWEVGSWRVHKEIGADASLGLPSFCAFSPDGRILAIAYSSQVIRLLSPTSGQEYATLASPFAQGITMPTFSPDGSLLAVACSANALQVWDLHAIRQRLAAMGLDWEMEPTPAGQLPPPALRTPPLHIDVEAHGLGVGFRQRRAALDLNNQAWRLVTGPVVRRDPKRAMQLMGQALELDPDDPHLLNTLGVVEYRTGRYRKAVQTFERSLAASGGQWDAFDLFFLAMCHSKLGAMAKAERCFDRGVRWAEAQKHLGGWDLDDLTSVRAEAAAPVHRKPDQH